MKYRYSVVPSEVDYLYLYELKYKKDIDKLIYDVVPTSDNKKIQIHIPDEYLTLFGIDELTDVAYYKSNHDNKKIEVRLFEYKKDARNYLRSIIYNTLMVYSRNFIV